MFLRTRTTRTHVGLDIGAHTVKAVQLANGGGKSVLVACASFPREVPGGPPASDECRQIRDVLRRQGFEGDRVAIAVPHDELKLAKLELPPLPPTAPLIQLARLELARVGKCDTTGMEVGAWRLPAQARATRATHVNVATFDHVPADRLLDDLEQGGLSVVVVDTHASALARAGRGAATQVRSVVVLDMGWTGATLALVHDGVLVYERRRKDLTLSALHARLAKTLDADEDAVKVHLAATGLRSESSDGHGGALRDAIVRYLDPLMVEVRRATEYLHAQYPDAPGERLLLTGGGVHIAGTCEHFQVNLDIEVGAADLRRTVVCAPALGSRLSPAMAGALGLALFTGGRA